MDVKTWNLRTCSECGKVAKLAKALGNQRALCPHCKAPLLAVEALLAEPLSAPQAIPTTRSFNPEENRLRSSAKSSWERAAPDLREIDFKDRLARTTDPDHAQGPNDPPPLKRKRISRSELKHRHLDWDEGAAATSANWRAWKRALAKLPWGLIALAVIALGLLGWKIMKVKGRLDGSSANESTTTQHTAPAAVPLSDVERRPKTTLLADLLPTLKSFLEAKSSLELKPLLREPERVLPMMEAYYQDQTPFVPADYAALPRFDTLFAHKNFVVVTLETKQYKPYTLSLEKTDGGWKVDWESYVAYGDMPLEHFLSTKPTKPTLFRFILETTSYPNLDFPDNDTHQAYKLYNADRSKVLFGYVVRQSAVHEKLLAAFLNKPTIYSVVRVQYPENSTNEQQVEITHYLQTGWVLRGEDFEMPGDSTSKDLLGNP